MKKRAISELRGAFILICVGIVYLYIVSNYGVAIPCLFHLVTGWLCPSCGITRMLQAMAQLDFYAAYGYNKALFITLPIILGILAVQEITYIKTGTRALAKVYKLVLWVAIAALLVFGVIRNLQ